MANIKNWSKVSVDRWRRVDGIEVSIASNNLIASDNHITEYFVVVSNKYVSRQYDNFFTNKSEARWVAVTYMKTHTIPNGSITK